MWCGWTCVYISPTSFPQRNSLSFHLICTDWSAGSASTTLSNTFSRKPFRELFHNSRSQKLYNILLGAFLTLVFVSSHTSAYVYVCDMSLLVWVCAYTCWPEIDYRCVSSTILFTFLRVPHWTWSALIQPDWLAENLQGSIYFHVSSSGLQASDTNLAFCLSVGKRNIGF